MKKKYISPAMCMVQIESSGTQCDGLMAASLKLNLGDAGSGNADTEWGAKEHLGTISGEEDNGDDLWQ